MILTKESKHKFIFSPYVCPYCGSDDLEITDRDRDNGLIEERVDCQKCEHTWIETYLLVSIYWMDEEDHTLIEDVDKEVEK